MEILELKEKLEAAINTKLTEFKYLADDYARLIDESRNVHDLMQETATELKSVEYIVRANGNDTHADLVDQLLDSKNKKIKK